MRVLVNRLLTEETPALLEEHRMHGRLEQYLDEAEMGLKSLTPAERSAELLEIRAHLEAMVQAEQELGATPEEAAKNALKQFGSAYEVTEQIVQAREEALKAPVRQLALALITSVAGGALSYLAYISLRWSESLGNGTMVRVINWPPQLAMIAAPLLLGTLVGKAFPRALHARLPLGVAALTWLLALLLPLVQPSTLTPWLTNPGQFFTDLIARVFSQSMLWWLFVQVPVALTFLMLAWAAQSVARRSGPLRGVRDWTAAVVHRLPDSWVGGLTLFTVVGRLIHTVFAMIMVLSGYRPSVEQMANPGLTMIAPLCVSALVSGWVVGQVLPRRGWTGGIPSLVTFFVFYIISRLSSHPQVQVTGEGYLLWISGTAVLGPMLIAFLVGRKRLAAR